MCALAWGKRPTPGLPKSRYSNLSEKRNVIKQTKNIYRQYNNNLTLKVGFIQAFLKYMWTINRKTLAATCKQVVQCVVRAGSHVCAVS